MIRRLSVALAATSLFTLAACGGDDTASSNVVRTHTTLSPS